ncbi:MAG TPA: adenosylcobinamide-phosphate synthase CbiB [Polyangiaceae bacterium]|nr:adenosylcobinamide-phosphate synthase CbiB [Polyangiaceae bacterium]
MGVFEPLAGVLLVAVALDALFGEPPNAAHPVAYVGTAISKILRFAPTRVPFHQFTFGAFLAFALPLAVAGIAVLFLRGSARVPVIQALLACAFVKCSFALRALADAGLTVRTDLERSVEAARRDLSSLCSRDASDLDEPELVAATVESLAENCSDSFVAPIFYYVLFGVPGAVAYRVINTLDAMVGYRGRFEYLGKVAARLDDVVNFVPARLTALALLAAGALLGRDVRQGVRILRRDRGLTESPNAGHPMAAMAGLLRIQLTKKDAYRLGDPLEPLAPDKIRDAQRVLLVAGGCVTLVALVAIHFR